MTVADGQPKNETDRRPRAESARAHGLIRRSQARALTATEGGRERTDSRMRPYALTANTTVAGRQRERETDRRPRAASDDVRRHGRSRRRKAEESEQSAECVYTR